MGQFVLLFFKQTYIMFKFNSRFKMHMIFNSLYNVHMHNMQAPVNVIKPC